MLVLVRRRISAGTVLQLEEVRLREVNSPTSQFVGVFLLVGLTNNEVDVVLTNLSIVCKSILNKGVAIVA